MKKVVEAMRIEALPLAILILIGTMSVSANLPSVPAEPTMSATLAASGDTYLKAGTPNTNEGASTFVRVQQSGPNRALIRFSQSEIQAAVDGGILVSAKVRMTIIDNGNNWGTTGRTVDVHRVLVDWTEGNGLNGQGATWNCPKDTNIANQAPDGPLWKDLGPPYKDGGSYAATPTSISTITNGMSGVVEWTVTADVAAFLAATSNYGWIIRKTDEGSSGRVDFASKENGVTNNRPQLVITYTSPPISKIVFTTSPQTLTAGVPSAVMTIQTQNANGNPANVASDTTIALSSTSHSGKFSLSKSPWSDAVSLTISAGSNSVSFYYKDTIAGTPTITAAENPSEGWIDATQQETVNLATVSIMITSSPAGSGFVKVDGSAITTPQAFTWAVGSTHTLEALSPVGGGAGIQYLWSSWSDGGGQTHTYNTPSSPDTVAANYATQMMTSTGSGITYLETGNCTLTDVSAVDEASLPAEGKPNLNFPHGFFSFVIEGVQSGGSAVVTITLPSPAPVGTQYWKYGPTPDDHTPHWYQLPMGDNDGDSTITITLVDGGLGDDDLTANGVIVDQGGPADPPAPAGPPVGGILTPVNKLSILATYMALFGLITTVVVVVAKPWKREN